LALFLPFTLGISPLMAVQDESFFQMWRIAAPAFLSVLVFGAAMRWIISHRFSKAEKAIAYFISVLSAYHTISLLFNNGHFPSEFIERFALVVAIVVLLSGSWLVISMLKKPSSGVYCPIIALQVAYLANCLMCLFVYSIEDYGWQIGAWLSLATAVIYLLQIYLFATQKDDLSDWRHEVESRNLQPS